MLLIPGAGCGATLRFGDRELERRGIELIAVSRPGMGDSDPAPGRTLTSTGRDISVLAAELGGPLPVIAHSQGAPFGLAAAAAGAASRLVLVSPVDEVAAPEVRETLPEPMRELVDAVGGDDAAAPAPFVDFTAEGLFDFVMSYVVPSDEPVFGDEGFRAHFREALEEGFRQGSEAYATDCGLVWRSWGLDLGTIETPTAIAFGSDDAGHAADLGVRLANLLPRASRVVIDGLGGSLLWARPDLVLDLASGASPG